jgi:hypothetical protein
MKLEPGKYCPLLKKDCIGLQCAWFMLVRGTNPQTGHEIDEWNCAMTWLPVLLIENSQQQRQTGAAVESFRNETVRNAEANREVAQRILQSNEPNVMQLFGSQGNPLLP